MGCLEDKIVQNLCAKILEAIYEPIFHRHSFGYRHGKSPHQALARVHQEIRRREDSCVVVEMDIEKFFDTIPHDKLMELIERRISEAYFLRLIRRMLRNSILSEDGELSVFDEMGTPQGSPITPMLANTWEGFERRLHFNPLPKPPNGKELIDITNGLGTKLKHKPRSRVRETRTLRLTRRELETEWQHHRARSRPYLHGAAGSNARCLLNE